MAESISQNITYPGLIILFFYTWQICATYKTPFFCMHNRYKPTYCNRGNTSTDTITPVSHLKFQRSLLFSVAVLGYCKSLYKQSTEKIRWCRMQRNTAWSPVFRSHFGGPSCFIWCWTVLWVNSSKSTQLLFYWFTVWVFFVIFLITTIMQSPHIFNFCSSKGPLFQFYLWRDKQEIQMPGQLHN